jgi:PAS domain S-box-containing protein
MPSVPDRINCGNRVLQDPERVLAVALQAYIAIDTAARVVAWNPAATTLFGYPHADACGRDVADLIIPTRYRQAHRAGLARLGAGEPGRVLGQRLQVTALHCDGHEFPIELTLTVTDEPGGRTYHAFAHDVTIAQRVSRFTAVEAAVAKGLAGAESSTNAATAVVDALGPLMGWAVTELWLADEPRQLITCAARHIAGGRRLGRFALDELEPGVGLPGRVYQQARPGWIPDLAADTGSFRSRAAARVGLHVAVGVPLTSGRHTLGALCVYGTRIEDPEDTLTALLTGLAAQVGQYLERRRAEELTVELARTKDEFLALVTHELRNPLAVIAAAASVLDDDLDTLAGDQLRGSLEVITRNTQRLSVLTDDLLDLARLESGHLAIEPSDIDLRDIITGSVTDLTTAGRDKNLTITVQMAGPLRLNADGQRLRQVADNLLSNAIKYTPAGGAITITAEQTGSGDIGWTVADTGIGIPAGERPHLFRRFYRTSAARQQHIPGTGLGLVITRTIIERHHGAISVADQSGPGTTFRIHLPAAGPASPQPQREHTGQCRD